MKPAVDSFKFKLSTSYLFWWCFTLVVCIPSVFANQMNTTSSGEYISAGVDFEYDSMEPGMTGLMRVSLELTDGWHTYWPGVSDSGYGLQIQIKSDPVFEIGEFIWPSPHRYLQPGDILDHVYEGQVHVLIPITVTEDFEPGQRVDVTVDIDALVCKHVCVPERAQKTAHFQIVKGQEQVRESEYADALRSLYQNRPRDLELESELVEIRWVDQGIRLNVDDAHRIEFYPDAQCSSLLNPISEPVGTNDLYIQLEKSEKNERARIFSGRLVVEYPEGHAQHPRAEFNIHQPERAE